MIAVKHETGSGAAVESALSLTRVIQNRDIYESAEFKDLPGSSSCVHSQYVTNGPKFAFLRAKTCGRRGMIAKKIGSAPTHRHGPQNRTTCRCRRPCRLAREWSDSRGARGYAERIARTGSGHGGSRSQGGNSGRSRSGQLSCSQRSQRSRAPKLRGLYTGVGRQGEAS